MQDLAEEGMTMVIVTHEIGFAEKVASRLIFIDKGRIAEDGNPQELVKNPPSPRLRLSLIHISEPTRLGMISYAVFCLKKKKDILCLKKKDCIH